ncbi:MAG TPA: hypothetical protein VM142_13335 [Acidimicrobiales bacterium]|nr:hypothetical protein [Acidimicrobiales bacterium]
MPKWPRGERTVQYLIDKVRLERVGADALPAMANLLLDPTRYPGNSISSG